MTRASKTRSALFTSIISLLLCVSMLVGTTFAWFTDVAETGLNQIIAGNLDVALLDAEGETVEGSTELFTMPELWEPGAVAYAQIQVANVGNLALKASMSINYVDVNDLNGHKLSEVLQYAVIDASGIDLTNREAVLEAAKASENKGSLSVYDFDFELEPGEKSPLQTLVIFWVPNEDTVDNLYNANNGKTTSDGKPLQINLGVKVFATQLDSESDAFGPDYDENISYPVEDADTLTDVLGNAKDGDIFTLTDDISVDELAMAADVTIDLNGNALTLGNTETDGDGLVIAEGKTLNLINNGTEKATIEYLGDNTSYDAIFVEGNGSELNIAGNVEIVVAPTASSAIHATDGAVVNIGEGTEIKVNGSTENRFTAIYIDDGATVNMNGGTISISSDLADNDGWNNDVVGVMLLGDNTAFNMNGGTINVHGKNAFTQAVQIATMNGSAEPAEITINGGTFHVTKDGGDSCAFAIYDPKQGNIVVNNATFTGDYDDAVITGSAGTPDITINGGTFAFDPSAFVAEGCSVTDNNGTWTVKQLYAVDANNNISVFDPAGLDEAIAKAQNGATITLSDGTYDLDDAGMQSKTLVFSGTKNAVIDMTGYQYGYASASGASLTFDGVTMIWAANEGYQGFAPINKLVYKNCDIKGLQYLHGETVFENCTFSNEQCWSIWTYGSKDVKFIGCTFNTGGHAVLVYNEDTSGTFENSISFTDCTFVNSGTVNEQWGHEDLVETSMVNPETNTNKYNLSFTNCTVTGSDKQELWGNKNNLSSEQLTVTVDGRKLVFVEVNSQEKLNETLSDVKQGGDIVTISLAAGEYTLPTNMSVNSGAYDVSIIGATNADGTPATVLNLSSVTSAYTTWSVRGTIENIEFKDETNSKRIWFTDGNGSTFESRHIAITNCVFDGASLQFNASATITDCTFDGNDAAWSGIQYSYPQGDVLIDGCTFGGYRFTNLQVTDEGAHKDVTVTVKNCTIGAMGENADSSAEGVTLYVDNIVLENNTIDCNVWTPSFANLTATNNTTSAGGEVTYKNW